MLRRKGEVFICDASKFHLGFSSDLRVGRKRRKEHKDSRDNSVKQAPLHLCNLDSEWCVEHKFEEIAVVLYAPDLHLAILIGDQC